MRLASLVSHSLLLNPGATRVATEDDEYNGYRIPKGTIVIANQWYVPTSQRRLHYHHIYSRAMLHNEYVYPEPHLFRPERFLDASGNLDPSVPDPGVAAFGFGRR